MEFPYVELVMGNGNSGIEQTTLVSRGEMIAQAAITDHMGGTPRNPRNRLLRASGLDHGVGQ